MASSLIYKIKHRSGYTHYYIIKLTILCLDENLTYLTDFSDLKSAFQLLFQIKHCIINVYLPTNKTAVRREWTQRNNCNNIDIHKDCMGVYLKNKNVM